MWRELAIETLVRPRAAARRVLALDLPAAALVQAAAAVACIGLVLGFAALRLGGGEADALSEAVLSSPFIGALAQFGMMALIAMLTYRIGRLFGGRGDFWGAVTAVVWLSAVTLGIQVAQLVALALVPPLAGLIAIATLLWLLWAFANFVAELHGFESPLVVVGVVVLTTVVLVFGLTLVAAVLGVTPQGA